MLKSKALHLQAMMAYSGSRGIDPLILNLGTRSLRVVSFTPRPIYLKGSYPIRGYVDHGHLMDISEKKRTPWFCMHKPKIVFVPNWYV